MADLVGQQLGNYRIVRLLGKGAFAEVYLGRHVLLETQAAIKVLHTKLTNDELEGFLTEARILRRLKHPLIVRVLDFAVEDGSPFLVMEYAPNGTLRQRHPQSVPIPLDTIVSYVKQVASALQYAHNERLIHRDVKPENMLVGKGYEILLSDFGFVTISQSSRAENVQDIAGTMAYMAPEQILAQPSRASDQYALGIVTYEWLCGQRPFDGTLEEIAAKHMSIAPPSLCERIPTLSPEVEMVVMRALEKEPSNRFASVQEFAEAFEQACMIGPEAAKWRESLRRNFPSKAKRVNPEIAEPNAPTPPVIPQPHVGFPSFMNRPERGVAPDEIIGFAGSRSAAQARAAMSGLAIEIPEIKSFSSQSYLVQALALSPDGKRVTFGGWDETVYVCDVAEGGKIFTYRGHSDQVHNLAWSPDGKFIASASRDKTLQVWDATSGGTVFTNRGPSESMSNIAWSPDSMRIASDLGVITAQVWDATTGNTLFTFRGHSESVVTFLAWSPDGTRIASSFGDGTVQVWDTSTRSIICTYRGHFDPVKAVAWSPDGKDIASGDDDRTVQVWNATTRSHILTARTHSHPMGVLIVGWSVDGKRIRIGYRDGSIEELDATTGNNVFTYHTHDLSGRFVSAITWTPDGTSIALGSEDRKVLVYDTVEDNTFVCRVPAAPVEVSGTSSSMGNYNAVQSITWSPDNTRIASANHDNTVRVWDAAIGSHIFTWVVNSPLSAVAWSPDMTRIVSSFRDGLVQVWDIATGKITCSYLGHTGPVEAVAWSPDGKRIASASGDWTVQMWDATTGDTFFTCSGSNTHIIVDSIAWSPDGKRLVSGSCDVSILNSGWGEGLVQVWDATNGNIMHTCRGHSDRVTTVAWSPDGTYFASGSNDTTVQVWDAASGKSVFTYHGHSTEVVDVAWSPDGKSIHSSSQDSIVQTWEATTGDNVFVHRGHIKYVKKVTAAAWKADGTSFAIGSEGGKLLICDAQKENVIVCNIPSNPVGIGMVTNDEQRRSSVNQGWSMKEWSYDSDVVIYSGHRSTVRSLAWSPDSGRIVSGGHDSTVHVWDAATATLIFTYREHLDPVVTVTWSHDGHHIASGSLDNTVHIWDVVTGRNILSYRGHAHFVWSVAWSPDGRRIASASEDGTVQIWDVNTGKHVFTYQGHSASVKKVAWSPDGKYIATGGDDRTVRVWDASTGKDIYIYRKHIDSVLSVAWSPDGKRIASGGDDKLAPGRDDKRTVQIWDAMNGENVISCGRLARMMYSLAWSPDGKYMASNEGPMVQVWNADIGDPVTAYQAHLNNEVFELLHVSWSPDGTRIAASDEDGKIWVGSVDLPDVPT